MYKKFSIIFIIFLISLVVLNIVLSQVLMKVYEHNSLDDIIEEQQAKNAIYGTLLNNHEFEYSLSLISHVRPDIIALGSSRVLAFREEFFSEKFVGAGRSVTQIVEAELFIERLIDMEHKPKTILLGLDFWWFHEDYAKRNISSRHISTTGGFASNKLRGIVENIIQDRVNISDVARKIMFGLEKEGYRQYKEFQSMGLNALHNFSGVRKDGSYFYGNIFTGKRISPDIKFKNTLTKINEGTGKFRYGVSINEQAWESLMRVIHKAKNNKIEIVLFYPPLSDKIFEAINNKPSDYTYINALTKRLEKLGAFFDFHDSSILNTSDCEFVDGFHGGEVTYARLLSYLNNQKILSVSDNINEYIELNSSNAVARLSAIERSYFFKEVDFLDLGCHK